VSPAEGDAGSRDVVAIDPENPWLGLFSYSEESRSYFHGRDEETAELARRVQRKVLTVLFGQSGLGKTSLLRAGIVPRLRAEGFCPVYVRIVYAPDSPTPSEQIKQAIFRATAAAGFWTRPGTAIEGESLWEFLHHRGDLLRDADGRTLIPLLIFDQFEEIFTLAQADDTGRLRAKQFLADLADLVENRPPAAVEARLEEDDGAAEVFDFARADYRILIALREDYLAHLEGVKTIMPSITQNRMRLARMNGAQALSAVVKPGGRLVSQEVAESIVRFVAGGSELANAEIEPSLLSLVCRELNTVRIAQGRSEISADLLAGSRETILSEFYERALADQPAGVRRVIEDELLTESGYRESLAEERVLKALAAAGAAPDSLAKLVDRRLLRIEERLDMRRVELTHDVLCSVVLSSRNLRHEREARDEAQRQLAAQAEREAASHRALLRARTIAGVCAVLMVIAIAGAVFGWINMNRARAADADAQNSRALAERARGDAEKLVGFLIEDFYAELAPTGRLETLEKLAHMTVSYYDGLPPGLVTPRTQTYRAMAKVREGAAQEARDDVDAAYKSYGEAQSVFEKLLAAGDTSETVTYGLALALYKQGFSVIGGGRGSGEQLNRAAGLLRPLVQKNEASRDVRQLYADVLNVYSHVQPFEAGVASCAEARKILVGLGALDLSDLNAAAAYADTADSEARHLMSLGRIDEAQTLEHEVYDLAEKILVQRPSDQRSLSDRYFAADLLSTLAARRHEDGAATDYAVQAAQAGEDAVRFNPSDLNTWGFWIKGRELVSKLQYERGEISQALASQHAMMALTNDKRLPSSLGPQVFYRRFALAWLEAQVGDNAAAVQTLGAAAHDVDELVAQFTKADPRRLLFSAAVPGRDARFLLIKGDAQSAFAKSTGVLARLAEVNVPATDRNSIRTRDNLRRGALITASMAALRLGHYAQAESLARERLAVPPDPTSEDDQQEESSRAGAALAHALAMQGKIDEARTTLEPALAYYEREQKAGATGTTFRGDYGYALYASALARADDADGRAKRATDLADAAKLVDGASAEARKLAFMRELAEKIATARAAARG